MTRVRAPRRLESVLQAHIIRQCKLHGVFARKVVSPGRKGFPDVLIVTERAVAAFACNGPCLLVEVKRVVGYEPDALQNVTHRELTAAGATVITLRGQEQVQNFLNHLFGAQGGSHD